MRLCRGAVVDVTPAAGDDSLSLFLVKAGRLSAERATSLGAGDDLERLLRHSGLEAKVLLRARRAAWIDRLVAGLGEVEARGEAPGEVRPLATADDARTEPLVPLILDALARRAAHHDAGAVGGRAAARLRFIAHAPALDEARAWAKLSDEDLTRPLAHLWVRHPGAAARIAALIRAGHAELVDDSDAPPPPKRPVSTPPAARTSLPPERPVSTPPGARSSLPPRRPPLQVLAPGATESLGRDELAAPLLHLPRAHTTLDDRLMPLERRLAHLEEVGAPGPARAEAWREFAQACQRELGSLEEAARAYREAAAADPTDYAALRSAATLCASTGRLDLARAYAAAATAAAPRRQRAGALESEARLLARAGALDAARTKLREAIEEGAGPEARLLLAELSDDEAVATELRRDAALQLRQTHPGRARFLLAGAASDGEALRTLARWRVEDGHLEAAVFALAAEVERSDDPDRRRSLRTLAAELAEQGQRPDLAFELLAAAHADEPLLEVLYEPLAMDAEAAGWPATVAVWLERLGTIADRASAGSWRMRAAMAFERLPGGDGWATELAVRALSCRVGSSQPADEALAWLRARAARTRDVALLADAYERAARTSETEGAVTLLVELAELAEARLGTVHRALWAWRRVHRLHPDHPRAAAEVERLSIKARVKEGLVRLAEEDHAKHATPASARRLAAMLRDHPDQRGRAVALYREALASSPEDRSAFASLERLLWLEGDEEGLLTFFDERAQAPDASRPERLRVLSLAAGLRAVRGDLRGAAEVGERLLALVPQHALATARLELAAAIDPDPALRQAADRARWAQPVDPRHARAHARALAREPDRKDEAIARARAALAADPRAADALAAFVEAAPAPSPETLELLRHARDVCGDEPPLLARGFAVARSVDRGEALRWITSWTRVLPLSLDRALDRLHLATELGDVSAIAGAAEQAIAALGRTARSSEALLAALEQAGRRLGDLEEPDRGARLLLHAVDRIGSAERLLPVAEALAEDLDTQIAVAERRVAWARARPTPLRRLAALHRQGGRRAAEARALLRLLAEDPQDEEALLRLATLYAETGEHERLMAALALRLECADDADTRLAALCDLAGAAASLDDDEQAEGFLAQLERECGEPVGGALLAAGVLVSAGRPERAIARLQERAFAPKTPSPARLLERAVCIAERVLGDEATALEIAADALERGVRSPGLMLAFERLALGLEATERARKTYRTLAERAAGRHGRRGTRYREARWLERAGLEEEALETYRRAFAELPSEGVVLSSIERLARSLGRWETLARTYESLAESIRDVERRVALVSEAARLRESELGDTAGAFANLYELWRTTQRSALVHDLRRLARRLHAQDEAAGAAATTRILEGLRERVETTWNSQDQVETLARIARIEAEDRNDLDQALRIVDEELLPKAEAEPMEVPRRLGALALGWAAGRLLDAGAEDEARRRLAEAERWSPDEPEIRALRERLGGTAPPQTRAEDGAERNRASAEHGSESDEVAPEAAHEREGDASARPDERVAADERDASDQVGAADERHPSDQVGAVDERDASDQVGAADERHPSDQVGAVDERHPSDQDGAVDERDASDQDGAADERDASDQDGAADERDASDQVEGRSYARPKGAATVEADAAAIEADAATQPRRRPDTDPLERWRSAPAPVVDPKERALREALACGDLDAGETLGQALLQQPGRVREGIRLLLRVLRADPARVDTLRALHRGAEAASATTLAEVCADLRSLFDGGPVDSPPAVDSDPPRAASLRLPPPPLLQALAIAWTGATPLFRRSLRERNVLGTQRITPVSNRPLGRAFAHCRAALDSATCLYVVADKTFGWVATSPVSVLAPEHSEDDTSTLPARLGRALELARPEHALLFALPPAEARVVTDALWAAFGPAHAVREVDREAARLAGDLWRILPSREQARVRRLFEALQARPSFDEAFDEARDRGAEACLFVEGRVSTAARALLADEPSLRAHSLDTPLRFAEACRASAPLRRLLRLAWSDRYLAARQPRTTAAAHGRPPQDPP